MDVAGIISDYAGADTAGFSGDGGPATNARFNQPMALGCDRNGNLYILDYLNGRVRKVDTNGIISTYAGNGGAAYSGDGGPATAAGLGGGYGLAVDTFGNVYIAALGRIRKVDTSGIISTYAGMGTGGAYNGENIPATAAYFGTYGQIAFDKEGNLYIADALYNRIRKITPGEGGHAGIITTIAGNGIAGYSGDGGPATNAEMNEPFGVYPDECGNVYFTDSRSNRVRVVGGNGLVKVAAGNGYNPGVSTGGYGGDGGPATAAEFHTPLYLYVDASGSIYIADESNARVRYVHMDSCRNTTKVKPVWSESGEVTIYPNPSSGLLVISNPGVADHYCVMNMLGQVLKEGRLEAGEQETDLRQRIRPGQYIIVFSKNGIIAGRRVFSYE